ncbi:expressed unknown protein [Seminavis robusta]|uniref:Uncharacterized protein n=1 Tax=Seminavis robusta TaxID=568900 RepID=A0A9N8DAF0_9STRA|nr:expressed unknown protein [Seminavis robusta]|eukprot:Sro64_g036300.1 n/a (150) ;mRNA; r:70604-71053
MTRTEMYTTWAASHYYLCHAWSVDFELMRKGIIVLAECAGYKWSRCNDIKVVEKVWMELLWSYHVKVQTAKHFNTSVMHNVFLSLLKGVLPTRLKSMFDTGYRSDNRLDEYYLVPSVEAANQRLLASLDFVLERRYNLEQSFSLSLPNE